MIDPHDLPAGVRADLGIDEDGDWLAGKTCNPAAPEECDACQ